MQDNNNTNLNSGGKTEPISDTVLPSIRIPKFAELAFGNKVQEIKPSLEQKTVVVVPKENNYMTKSIVYGSLAFIVILASIFVYKYALNFMETKEKAFEQSLVTENPIFRADISRVISLQAGVSKELVRGVLTQALLNERVQEGQMSIITPSYLRESITDNRRILVSEPQRGDDFFFTFFVRTPINLRTLIGNEYALGTAGIGNVTENGPQNFMAISVTSTVEGKKEMIRYEEQIYYDLKDILKLKEIKGNFVFKDIEDRNQELRLGYDDEGLVMVYGFPNSKRIVIARDPETYHFLVSRMK